MLADAVASLRGAVRPGDEVLVVDSASRLPSACQPAVAAGVRVVRAERPGLSRARNIGLAATSAPLVAFTDDDCRPTPGWAEALAEAFVNPATGFVTGRVMADRPASLVVSVVEATETRRFAAGTDPFVCGTGANMAFRRVALDAVGPFDETLGAGARLRAAEDIDMFWRLLRGGWEGRYAPDAEVRHQQWRSTAQAIRMGYGYGLGAGALAVKVIRVDGRPGWRMLSSRLGRHGVGRAVADARAGYKSGLLAATLTAAGVAAGAARASRLPLSAERFSSG
jgi:GT2 family glycosyltransferase